MVPIAVLATSTDVDRVLQVLETYPSALDQMVLFVCRVLFFSP